jgi:hypothetical protein
LGVLNDQFAKILMGARCEMRAALTVPQPAASQSADLAL